MSERSYVFEGTRRDAELDRLRALEVVFDLTTRKRLLASGLGAGWRCLEVGAGAGSIAKWMADTVGESGHVMAVDLDTRFLSAMEKSSFEVCTADIRTASIHKESFDLVHARFVLIHVPDWLEALATMIRSLRPAGWLVLEEPDFSCSRPLAGPHELQRAFENVHKAIEVMFQQRGMNYAFGARLPALFQDGEFEEISIENDAAIVRGGSPHAKMMGMSTYQLRDKYVATGLATEQDIELYGAFAADPTCWATYHATISAAGRKR
jgi:ubiquinone/menaquinone biosynthesis C-methylase UbiE